MTKRLTHPHTANDAEKTDGLPIAPTGSARPVSRLHLRTPRPIKDRPETDILFRVELALSRLENGDYGYCLRCEAPIAIETLEDDPSAVICDDCARPDA